MIDFPVLVQALSPFMPALLEVGKGAAKACGEDAWKAAKDLWGRLLATGESDPGFMETATILATVQQSAIEGVASQSDLEQAQVSFSRSLLELAGRLDISFEAWQAEVTQFIEIAGGAGDIHQISKRSVSASQKVIVTDTARVKDVIQEA